MRLTDEQIAALRDDLTKRLEIKADMLAMGERIAFGSDSAIMRQAAETIQALATVALESRAEIARLREALILIMREQQSEAQAGTGDYQRGYDDCIAAHAEIARAALGRDAT
jgi:hypothetical protein